MKGKTNIKEALFAVIFITLFLITIYGALAEIEVNTYSTSKEFYVTSAFDKLNVCECSTKFDIMTITNTGSYDTIFTINTNELKGKVTFSEVSFNIPSHESKDIFIYYNSPCASGSEEAIFTISSNLGVQKEIKKEITTQKCQNLQMWVIDYQKTGNTTRPIMPCSEAKYNVGIKNVGTYTETYIISNNYDVNTKYSANKVTLFPEQVFEFDASIKFDCSIYGDKEIIFSAHSQNNNLEAQLSTKLSILRAYEYSVFINNNPADTQNEFACNRIWMKQIPVTITNNAVYKNNFTFDTESLPKFVSIDGLNLSEEGKFSLNPSEAKTFYLNIDTHEFRNEDKTYTFKLNFISELGDIEKTKEVSLNVLPCYEHTISIINKTSQNNAKEICSTYLYTYYLLVENKGKYTETIRLSLDGNPGTASFSKNRVTLMPGENETIKLSIFGPETNYLYNIKATATLSNGIETSDNLWIKANTEYQCHNVEINNNKFRINYDPEMLTTVIENKGIVEGDYKLVWKEDSTNLLDLKESSITLEAGEKKALHFDIDSQDKEEAVYTGTLTIQHKDSDMEYSEDIKVTLKDKTMLRKTFEYFIYGTVCRQFSFYELAAIMLVVALIIFFQIKGPHYPYKFWNRIKAKKIILLILLCIFLGALIFIILITGLPKSHNQVYNLTEDYTQLRFEILENDKFTLDASKFFTDPDNNTLKYTVSESKHIKSIVNGNSVTFYPDYAWYGNESIIITASDSFGGYADSPSIKLIIKHTPGMTGLQWYNSYCWYVNLGIFLIILILIFLMFVVKQEKRVRKKK